MSEVLAVETPSPPGIERRVEAFERISINVSYLYTCLGTGEKTVLIMGVDKMEEAIQC